jgi:hypothetical protein
MCIITALNPTEDLMLFFKFVVIALLLHVLILKNLLVPVMIYNFLDLIFIFLCTNFDNT